ncbi:MAG: glycosyltransferase [Cyanobacteria bacterium RM1_2_2]|nr:glycosyltransferase [Cyanobacteria bacterium RM1_2_2]
MITSYQGLTQGDWLWKQTPQPFGVWKNIQLLKNAPNPDFLVMYQYDFWVAPPKRSWQKILGQSRSQEASCKQLTTADLKGVPKDRAIYLQREPPLEEIVHKNTANYEAAKAYCGYISGPDDFAPTPDYMPAIWYLNNSFRELTEMSVPEKINRCSWITSGINRTANHRKRLAFLEQIQQVGLEVDLYGRNLPQTAQTMGELDNKWFGMAPYYYNLSIENYADNDWYVSEKLWDSLLSWCLPIYYGGPAADRLLPPGSFLRLPSLDEKGVAYIREVTATPDAWYAAKEAIAEARQIILHKLNLLNWLSEFAEKAEG